MKPRSGLLGALLLGPVVGGALLAGCAAPATKEAGASLPALAEQVRKGEVDVGKSFGTAPDRRFHKIHAEAVGLPCATCHVGKVGGGGEVFASRPAVDVSPASPGLVDRRACLGCHLTGPGKGLYTPPS